MVNKAMLDQLYDEHNHRSCVHPDPLEFPVRGRDEADADALRRRDVGAPQAEESAERAAGLVDGVGRRRGRKGRRDEWDEWDGGPADHRSHGTPGSRLIQAGTSG